MLLMEKGTTDPVVPPDIDPGAHFSRDIPKTIEEWEQRLDACKSIREWTFLARHCPDPDPDDGYDVIKELNKIRKAAGARLLTAEDNT